MLFKQRKPKQFNYKSRHGSQSETDHKERLRSQWDTLKRDKKNTSSNNKLLVYFLIALGMIIVLWFVLNKY